MNQNIKKVILISTPGIVREATIAVLASLYGIHLIGIASGALSATRLLQQDQPDLLLVDANLPDEEVLTLLRWIEENCTAVSCLVLTTTPSQREQVLTMGACATIQRANLAEELEMVLDQLTSTNLSSGEIEV